MNKADNGLRVCKDVGKRKVIRDRTRIRSFAISMENYANRNFNVVVSKVEREQCYEEHLLFFKILCHYETGSLVIAKVIRESGMEEHSPFSKTFCHHKMGSLAIEMANPNKKSSENQTNTSRTNRREGQVQSSSLAVSLANFVRIG